MPRSAAQRRGHQPFPAHAFAKHWKHCKKWHEPYQKYLSPKWQTHANAVKYILDYLKKFEHSKHYQGRPKKGRSPEGTLGGEWATG